MRVKYADYEVEDCRGKKGWEEESAGMVRELKIAEEKKLGGRISRYGERVEV